MNGNTKNYSRLIQTFLDLVQIDSESGNERAICDELIQRFKLAGGQVTEDDTAARTGHTAGNLLVEFPASAGYESVPSLLYTSHMDTVSPGLGIKPQVDPDGYIRSDGTTILGSDDKAGIAVILESLFQLQETGDPHGRILIVITVGEESGLIGASAIDPQAIQADYGFAFDSNGKVGDIIVGAPTQSKMKMTVIGKSAHAGVNPEDGISAIQVASKAISKMKLGRVDQDTTANIGRFEGGGATNIVCERVLITAEARSLNEAKMLKQTEAMKQALHQAAAEWGATAEFESETLYPSYHFKDNHPMVKLTSKAVESIGRKACVLVSGGGSDANIFNGHGIPTLNLAIGYEHIHTCKEQMPIAELDKAAELAYALILHTAQEKQVASR